MHGRLQRVLVAATLSCMLLAPAAGSLAGPQDQLDRTEEQLDDLRSRIDEHENQAGSLRDHIDQLNADITDLQIAINKLDVQIARVEGEVRTVKAKIDRTKTKIERVEGTAIDQATELYKSSSTETLDTLLDSKTIGELNDRMEMLGVAAQENTGALVEYSRLKFQLQAHNQDLFEKQEILTSTRDSQADLLARRDSLRDKLTTELGRLRDKLGLEKAQEGHLEDKAAELEDDIIAAQAQSSVASLGTSASGFIWPLNGAITSPYGYRWGGMHTGIDIDGVTGQPIVAAKSGRVIMAGAYSGYGNAVIIDHGGGISTLYGHMSGFATSSGASIGQGQVLGYVGCTGSCTGDHLHFEVRVNGSPVDPMGYLP
jgi:murein DD-endopeptidase MepM/ murein hydrolase activator NlpD